MPAGTLTTSSIPQMLCKDSKRNPNLQKSIDIFYRKNLGITPKIIPIISATKSPASIFPFSIYLSISSLRIHKIIVIQTEQNNEKYKDNVTTEYAHNPIWAILSQ